MVFLICYDIASPKRLRKTAKTMENYGLRVQKSFFQCDMEEDKMHDMLRTIKSIIERRRDSFFVYPICSDCAGKVIIDGQGDVLHTRSYEVL